MFTYRDYYDLLTSIPDGTPLFLRHDVDISPKKASEMAEREYKMSIGPAVYFFMSASDFYNLYSKDTRRRIKQILDMGHKIGFHYDLRMYPDNMESQAEKIAAETFLMEHIFDTEITSIVAHEPVMGKKPKYELLTALQVCGLHDASFTLKGYKYISDSGMNFREDPYDALKIHKKIHFNFHPEWWDEKEGDFKDRLHSLKLDREVDRKINKHISHINEYREVIKR